MKIEAAGILLADGAVFRQCIAEECARGRTVLLSSHILSEVEALCDRVSQRDDCYVHTPAPGEIKLQEWKKRYNATFRNRLQAIPEGTRYTLRADIALKGVYRFLAPFVRGYIRRQIAKLVLEPMRMAAEGGADREPPQIAQEGSAAAPRACELSRERRQIWRPTASKDRQRYVRGAGGVSDEAL
ncbi:MAG TPA: hypothetical protein VFU22_06540 [Roseiflexaceae bacterium]|nr:hypothetical protein [Roseiflexaceae bacterium]